MPTLQDASIDDLQDELERLKKATKGKPKLQEASIDELQAELDRIEGVTPPQQIGEEPERDVSAETRAKAFGAGIAEMGLLGGAGEVGGLLKTASRILRPGTAGGLRAPGAKPLGEVAREDIRETEKQIGKLEEEAPGSFLAGEATGALLSPLSRTRTLKQAVGVGAVTGALKSKGEIERDIDVIAEDAASGAIFAAGFQFGVQALANKIRRLPEASRELAWKRAIKATTGNNKKLIQEMQAKGQGKFLLEKDEAGKPIVTAFAGPEKLAQRIQGKLEEYGESFNKLSKHLDDQFGNKAVSTGAIADRIEAHIAKEFPEGLTNPDLVPFKDKLLRQAEFFRGMDDLSFTTAQNLKRNYKWKFGDPSTQSLTQQSTNAVNKAIAGEMSEAAKRGSAVGTEQGKAAAKKYLELKERYGAMKNAEKGVMELAARNASNRAISPSDMAMLGVGMITGTTRGGGPIQTVAEAALFSSLNHFGRTRGSGMVSVTANRISKAMQSAPGELRPWVNMLLSAADEGGTALATAHQTLLNVDDAYQSIISKFGLDQPEGLRPPQQIGE